MIDLFDKLLKADAALDAIRGRYMVYFTKKEQDDIVTQLVEEKDLLMRQIKEKAAA